MSLNEILWIAVVSVLLLSGVMFRIALYYRDQVKALKELIENLKFEIRVLKEECNGAMKIIGERNEDIRKYEAEIKERDKLIKKFKQQTEEHEKAFRNISEVVATLEADVQSRDEKIQRLTQELKPRDEAVKAPPHKNKKSKKKGK
ncbi:hypothetical protein [Bartonella sp. CM100XJJH]|uniref:hypothetical protein n=1 Tax=Bartonella sp. CM100XJJH TaxID=3243543 RepID=UPI0035CF31F9